MTTVCKMIIGVGIGLVAGAGAAMLINELTFKKEKAKLHKQLNDATLEYMNAKAKLDKEYSAFNRNKPSLILESMNNALGYSADEPNENEPEMEEDEKKEGGAEMVVMAINEDKFGDKAYKKVYLTLYSDNVLAEDDTDEIVFPEDYVGFDAVDDMDKTPGATIYIRNQTNGVDYCITRNAYTFREATGLPYTGGEVDDD